MKNILISLRNFIDKDPGTILGIIFVIIILIIIFLPLAERWYKGKRRSEAFRKAAENLGFAFSAKSDFLINDATDKSGLWDYLSCRISGLRIFGIRYEKIRNVIRNINISHGEMTIFDFYYMEKYKSRFKSIKTCALAEYGNDTKFPHFVLRPANFINRFNDKMFSPGNTDFGTYREFSKKYSLYCWDKTTKDLAIRVFSPFVIAALEKTSDLTIYADDRYIAYCSSDGGIKPEELASFAADSKNIIQMIHSNLTQSNPGMVI